MMPPQFGLQNTAQTTLTNSDMKQKLGKLMPGLSLLELSLYNGE